MALVGPLPLVRDRGLGFAAGCAARGAVRGSPLAVAQFATGSSARRRMPSKQTARKRAVPMGRRHSPASRNLGRWRPRARDRPAQPRRRCGTRRAPSAGLARRCAKKQACIRHGRCVPREAPRGRCWRPRGASAECARISSQTFEARGAELQRRHGARPSTDAARAAAAIARPAGVDSRAEPACVGHIHLLPSRGRAGHALRPRQRCARPGRVGCRRPASVLRSSVVRGARREPWGVGRPPFQSNRWGRRGWGIPFRASSRGAWQARLEARNRCARRGLRRAAVARGPRCRRAARRAHGPRRRP